MSTRCDERVEAAVTKVRKRQAKWEEDLRSQLAQVIAASGVTFAADQAARRKLGHDLEGFEELLGGAMAERYRREIIQGKLTELLGDDGQRWQRELAEAKSTAYDAYRQECQDRLHRLRGRNLDLDAADPKAMDEINAITNQTAELDRELQDIAHGVGNAREGLKQALKRGRGASTEQVGLGEFGGYIADPATANPLWLGIMLARFDQELALPWERLLELAEGWVDTQVSARWMPGVAADDRVAYFSLNVQTPDCGRGRELSEHSETIITQWSEIIGLNEDGSHWVQPPPRE